jgi:hypothetical protein
MLRCGTAAPGCGLGITAEGGCATRLHRMGRPLKNALVVRDLGECLRGRDIPRPPRLNRLCQRGGFYAEPAGEGRHRVARLLGRIKYLFDVALLPRISPCLEQRPDRVNSVRLQT